MSLYIEVGGKVDNIQSESVTGFRIKYKEVIKKAAISPVLLLQNSQVAAVVVSPGEWNQLQHYKRIALLDEQSKLVQQGDYLTQEQVEQGLRERGLLV